MEFKTDIKSSPKRTTVQTPHLLEVSIFAAAAVLRQAAAETSKANAVAAAAARIVERTFE